MSFNVGVANIYEFLEDETDANSRPLKPSALSKDGKPLPVNVGKVNAGAGKKTAGDAKKAAANKAPARADRADRKVQSNKVADGGAAGSSINGKAPRRRDEKDPRDRKPRADGEQGGNPNKRQFDRKSGTGRGKEGKKGGAGKRNWGTEKDELEAVASEGAPPKKEEGEQKEGEAKEEEEDDGPAPITLEEFMKSKQAGKHLTAARAAGEGEDNSKWKEFVPLKKETRTNQPASTEASKETTKAKKSTSNKLAVDAVFQVQYGERPNTSERPQRGRGGARGSRGGFGRGAGAAKPRGGGNAQKSSPKFDDSSFPSLS